MKRFSVYVTQARLCAHICFAVKKKTLCNTSITNQKKKKKHTLNLTYLEMSITPHTMDF